MIQYIVEFSSTVPTVMRAFINKRSDIIGVWHKIPFPPQRLLLLWVFNGIWSTLSQLLGNKRHNHLHHFSI